MVLALFQLLLSCAQQQTLRPPSYLGEAPA